MATILLTIVIALLVFAAMSVGIIFGRPPIKGGSCGGMSALAGGDGTCQVCGGDSAKCPETDSKDAKSGAGKPAIFDPNNPG